MIPVVIPSPGGACFGIYTPGPGPAVLMCPPFGDEALKTARVWRDLALDLAAHGVASLRFDLPGTGNSAGEAAAPGRVEAWRAAVRACAHWLANHHGGRIILFGHRFGALLALDAAASGVRAERLILLDPPASGAAAARYLRARARLAGLGPAPEGEDTIQVGGVPLSATTLRDLAALPAPLQPGAVPHALLVLDGEQNPWPQRLRAAGSQVETAPFEGFADFVPHDAFQAKPPQAVLDRIVATLTTHDPLSPRERVRVRLQPAQVQGEGFTETPVRFGPDDAMFGILCTPDRPRRAAPALLLPTTGIDPCCGLSGMWTELARRVARDGVTSLRFDMRGVGESDGPLSIDRLVAAYHPDRMLDIGHAIDALAARGFDRTTVVAYCSGAYAAWHAAVPDRRIAGVLTGNLLYLSRHTTLASDALRQKPGSSQLRLPALRRLDDRLRGAIPRPIRHLLRGWGADPKATRRHVRALTARGCSISIVTAQDDHGHVRLRRAYGDALRLPKGVELSVIADADHQFSDRRHRARFLDLAAAFALRHPSPAAQTARPAPTRILEIVQ